jgi:hypothetical protein
MPTRSTVDGAGFTIRLGGSRSGDHAARRDAWRRVLDLVEAPSR